MNARDTPSAPATRVARSPVPFMARVLLLMACAWPLGSHAEVPTITWTQTVQFSFDATAPTIARSEGGGAFLTIQDVWQSDEFNFSGALSSFQIGNNNYVLTSVNATLTSTYSSVVEFAGYDCCFMTDVYIGGSLQSIIETQFSFEPSVTTVGVQQWSDWLMDECWVGNCNTLKDYSIVTQFNRQWNWQDASYFTQSAELQLELSKYAVVEMTKWRDDDTWSEVRNPLNQWSGSVTLEYLYEAQPVSEPPTLGMSVSGLLVVAALVARRRQAARRDSILLLADSR